jgi:lipoprotein signal peptidase
VFNVADMAITCGVIWLLISSFRKPHAGAAPTGD